MNVRSHCNRYANSSICKLVARFRNTSRSQNEVMIDEMSDVDGSRQTYSTNYDYLVVKWVFWSRRLKWLPGVTTPPTSHPVRGVLVLRRPQGGEGSWSGVCMQMGEGSAPRGRPHRKLETIYVILSSSREKKLVFFGTRISSLDRIESGNFLSK